MAKSWAKKFYNSMKWKKARALKIATEHGICQRCGKSFPSNKLICHHLEYLTEENIHDEKISLNQDNLECVCRDCHNKEHMTAEQERIIQFNDDGNICYVRDKQSE